MLPIAPATISAKMIVTRLRSDRRGRSAASRDRRGRCASLLVRVTEAVPNAAHGEDVLRLLRVGLELLAQVADVDVYGARISVGRVAPHAREQHVARVDPPGIGRERGEDLELDVGRRDRLPVE